MDTHTAQIILADYADYRRSVGIYEDEELSSPRATPAEIGRALDVALAVLTSHAALVTAARTVVATRRSGTRSQSLVLTKALKNLENNLA